MEEAELRLPSMTQDQKRRIKYTQLPGKRDQLPGALTPAQITSQSIDMTFRFERLLAGTYESNIDNCLCELQFSFIAFLVGHCHDSFEQWKNLVHLICNCEALIDKFSAFYIDFIAVIYYQLKELPQDFFIDLSSRENFLTVCLHNLVDNVGACACVELKEKCAKFKAFLGDYFKIDFDAEPDEYAPTVCDDN